MDGFDEFPQPLRPDQISTLRRESLRLSSGYRQLLSALSYYQKVVHNTSRAAAAIRRKRDALLSASTQDSAPIGEERKRPREDGPEDNSGHAIPLPPPQRKRIQLGGLLSSMKKLVEANRQADEADGTAAARAERERVARAAQLEQYNSELLLVEEKERRASDAVSELEKKLASIEPRRAMVLRMTELSEMRESEYIASFFLRASGARQVEDEGGESSNTAARSGASDDDDEGEADYDVFFAPAMHTEESRDMVRAQVYEVLDDYFLFRSEIDPLLGELEESQQKKALSDAVPTPASCQDAILVAPVPMSAEEASLLVRLDKVEPAAEVSTAEAKKDDDEVKWSVFEEAIAALNDFE